MRLRAHVAVETGWATCSRCGQSCTGSYQGHIACVRCGWNDLVPLELTARFDLEHERLLARLAAKFQDVIGYGHKYEAGEDPRERAYEAA